MFEIDVPIELKGNCKSYNETYRFRAFICDKICQANALRRNEPVGGYYDYSDEFPAIVLTNAYIWDDQVRANILGIFTNKSKWVQKYVKGFQHSDNKCGVIVKNEFLELLKREYK